MSWFRVSDETYSREVPKLKVKVDPSLKKNVRRGRPKYDASLNQFMRVPSDLIEIAKYECKESERLGDTILRVIREKAEQINVLRQEIDRLRSNVNPTPSTSNYTTPVNT